MHIVYSSRYYIDIGAHIWPIEKYRLIHEHLLREGVLSAADIVEPTPATWTDLAVVHAAEYLDKVRTGRLTPEEIATLEIPWLPEIVDGFLLMTGGTQLTADLALQEGIAVHLGGGFHHAFANHGEGFCMFNDVAVAIGALQRHGRIRSAAVVDCDVHHGNGTAMIFEGDPSVFTFSIHQQHNYPLFKPRSDLDIGLEDGTGDAEYLRRTERALQQVMGSGPDLVFYLAGADPFGEDQLGGLALTLDGLRQRDALVLRVVRDANVSIALVLAGGYAKRVEDTVAIHVATVEEALRRAGPQGRAGR